MGLVHKIKFLCNEKNITFAELEREIGLSNGQIRRWDDSSPKAENIQKVADYFNVSTDFLLGRNLGEEDPEVRSLARDIQSLDNGDKKLLKDLIKTMRKRGKEALDE